jgi:MFS family permease
MSQPTSIKPIYSRSRQINIALYIAVAFLFWFSLFLYVPTLPTYIQSKTGSLSLVGIVLATYGFWQAIVRLPLGILADWSGRRKPFILIGVIFAGLGAWLMGTATGPAGLLAGRSITGFAAAAWVPLLVAFNSLFPVREIVRATIILTICLSLSRLLATALTGPLNEVGGYALPFFLAAGVAGLALLFLIPTREEKRPPEKPSFGRIGRLISRRDVLLPAVLAALTQYVDFATTFGFLPILTQRLGGGNILQGMLVSTYMTIFILGNFAARFLVRLIGSRSLVYLAFVLLSGGTMIAAWAPGPTLLFAGQFLIGTALGISYPVLMGLSIRFVRSSEQNTAMGLHQSVYAIGMFSGPWISGILADEIGLRSMLVTTALGTLALGLFGTSKLVVEKATPD